MCEECLKKGGETLGFLNLALIRIASLNYWVMLREILNFSMPTSLRTNENNEQGIGLLFLFL